MAPSETATTPCIVPDQRPPTGDSIDGYEIVSDLQEQGVVCAWCFAPLRRFHPEYEKDLADHLVDSNRGALKARGHGVEFDKAGFGHAVVGDVRESTLLPGVIRDNVPDTEIVYETDGVVVVERRSATKQTVCSCGVIDLDPTQRRDRWTLYECVENIAEALDIQGFDTDPEAMTGALEDELDNCRPGNDRELLGAVVEAGVRHEHDTNVGVPTP